MASSKRRRTMDRTGYAQAQLHNKRTSYSRRSRHCAQEYREVEATPKDSSGWRAREANGAGLPTRSCACSTRIAERFKASTRIPAMTAPPRSRVRYSLYAVLTALFVIAFTYQGAGHTLALLRNSPAVSRSPMSRSTSIPFVRRVLLDPPTSSVAARRDRCGGRAASAARWRLRRRQA